MEIHSLHTFFILVANVFARNVHEAVEFGIIQGAKIKK